MPTLHCFYVMPLIPEYWLTIKKIHTGLPTKSGMMSFFFFSNILVLRQDF